VTAWIYRNAAKLLHFWRAENRFLAQIIQTKQILVVFEGLEGGSSARVDEQGLEEIKSDKKIIVLL
jgi:hypothetical protein